MGRMPCRRARVLLGLGLLVGMALSTAGCTPAANRPEPRLLGIRLVVVIVADQISTDLLDRVTPALDGGLARLQREGVVFREAAHLHALTKTAAGHASLVTGAHPRRSGIVDNDYFDREEGEWVYAVEDERYDRAPTRLLVDTFSDRLKEITPGTRVYTVSGKDRSAILLGGRRADGAYWYDRGTGGFTSSHYYPDDGPDWLRRMNGEAPANQYFGRVWEPLPGLTASPAALGVMEPDEGAFPRAFPYPIGEPTTRPGEIFYDALYETPFVDELVLTASRRLVEARELGRDEIPDFLAVSFSSTDAVGHDHGPNSLEMLDAVRRLDRVVGELLSYLEERLGSEHLLVALSSDHGVMPLPEVLRSQGLAASREGATEVACVQATSREWSSRLGARFEGSESYREALAGCPKVRRVWMEKDFRPYRPSLAETDPYYRLYYHGFHATRSPRVIIQWEENHLQVRGRGTSHYGPYPEDRRVPMLVWSPALPAREVSGAVGTVDLAPTLAGLLGVPMGPDIDGVDRSESLVGGIRP